VIGCDCKDELLLEQGRGREPRIRLVDPSDDCIKPMVGKFCQQTFRRSSEFSGWLASPGSVPAATVNVVTVAGSKMAAPFG
jgi:hypothetical protein